MTFLCRWVLICLCKKKNILWFQSQQLVSPFLHCFFVWSPAFPLSPTSNATSHQDVIILWVWLPQPLSWLRGRTVSRLNWAWWPYGLTDTASAASGLRTPGRPAKAGSDDGVGRSGSEGRREDSAGDPGGFGEGWGLMMVKGMWRDSGELREA